MLRYGADEGFLGSKSRPSTRAPKCLLRKQEITTLQCRVSRLWQLPETPCRLSRDPVGTGSQSLQAEIGTPCRSQQSLQAEIVTPWGLRLVCQFV